MSSLDIARRFIDAMNEMDFEALVRVLDDDAEIRTPYAPHWLPNTLKGRAQWGPWMENFLGGLFSEMEIYDIDLHQDANGDRVFGTGRSTGRMANGNIYENDYCWMFQIRDGKIVNYLEYFNPLKVIEAFGDEEEWNRQAS